MAQDKYLSPREILKRLCFLESRIPRSHGCEYKPVMSSYTGMNVTEQQINDEARRILAFMGMFTYNPVCVFDSTLPDNVGGMICLKGIFSGDLNVSINPNIRGNADQILACLAHELCHKRLEDSHVKFDTVEETEYHTDLCTIYMGLGDIILRGYNVGSNAMGYLKKENYRHAYDIMQAVRNLTAIPKGAENGFLYSDIFLSEAFCAWTEKFDKHQLLKSTFQDKVDKMSVLARNTHLVRQLLDKIDSYPQKGLRWYSDAYSLHESHPDFQSYPIHAFAALYDMETTYFDDELQSRVDDINKVMMSLLASLENYVPEFNESALRYDRVVCPFCGAEKCKDDIRGERRIMRCGKCKSYFVADRRCLDLKGVRSLIDEKICEASGNAAIEAYSRGKKNGFAEGKAEKEKEFEDRIQSVKKQYEDYGVQKYQQGLSVAKGYRAAELKKEILQGVPRWLRWVVARYIKE